MVHSFSSRLYHVTKNTKVIFMYRNTAQSLAFFHTKYRIVVANVGIVANWQLNNEGLTVLVVYSCSCCRRTVSSFCHINVRETMELSKFGAQDEGVSPCASR